MMLLCLYLRKLVYSEQILVNTHGVFGSLKKKVMNTLKKKVMNSIVIYKKSTNLISNTPFLSLFISCCAFFFPSFLFSMIKSLFLQLLVFTAYDM